MGGNKERSKKYIKNKVKLYKKKKVTPETQIIADLRARYETIDEANIKRFSDLPLSTQTQKALDEIGFVEPTDIQRQSIPLALKGNDILGAAKTGSGKTLAFLIPVVESLYCQQWFRELGLGALIITPTRELACQIHDTLEKLVKYHRFKPALIIGGKDLNYEKNLMDQFNIIVCTPGRILQHMDGNRLMHTDNLKLLVLDEADRCLDEGFKATMNAIIENLPPERQTLLFSATQTKSVKDLARLSLTDPMYVSVHEHAKYPTPEGLQQSYVVVALEDKMEMLWSFIKYHLKQKTIVFFSTCKQVKYTYEAFCRMRPGVSLLALYGRLHQRRRREIYDNFCRKNHAVLFATDIASRGLDFPGVNWVVQMDCPEDVNAYIHRAGRTARFQKGGESLLVLLPSELQMVNNLEERRIPINKIEINSNKQHCPKKKLAAQLVRDVELKKTAQRCFVSYIKSVNLMKDKKIFNIHALNTDAYAYSLGLAIPPRIRCLEKLQWQQEKNKQKNNSDEKSQEKTVDSSESDDDDDDNEDLTEKLKKHSNSNDEDSGKDSDEAEEEKEERMEKVISKGAEIFGGADSDDDEDILTVKRKNVQIEGEISEEEADEEMEVEEKSKKNKKALTKAAVAKKLMKKKILPNKKITFDEEGEEKVDTARSKVSELARQYEQEGGAGIDIEMAKQVLREEDKFDKQRFREKVKEKHREEKRKKKEKQKEEDDDEEEEEHSGDEDYSEGESDEGPDLSWLPDPDKIYGPKASDDEDDSGKEQQDEEEEEEEEEEVVHKPTKRKLATIHDDKRKRPRIKVTEKSDLQATEELALQLLRS